MLSFNYLSALVIMSTLGLISACSEQQANQKKTAVAVPQIIPETQQAQLKNTTTNSPLSKHYTDKVPANTDNIAVGSKVFKTPLTVYKTPTCGCCKKWIAHIEQHQFNATSVNQNSLTALKSSKGIAPAFRSCHTAISADGYVFEGHVPAKFIQQFLANPPRNAIGLSVPAMPLGSPGMEVDDRFMPYKVILLNSDGSHAIYASLSRYEEQF